LWRSKHAISTAHWVSDRTFRRYTNEGCCSPGETSGIWLGSPTHHSVWPERGSKKVGLQSSVGCDGSGILPSNAAEPVAMAGRQPELEQPFARCPTCIEQSAPSTRSHDTTRFHVC